MFLHIPGYSRYLISEDGQIFDTTTEQMKSPSPHRHTIYVLKKDGETKWKQVSVNYLYDITFTDKYKDNENEEWRPIEGTVFEVSNLARFRNSQTGKIIKYFPKYYYFKAFPELFTTDGEEWRPLDFDARYEISNTGKVRNVKTMRLLKQTLNKDGYLTLSFKINDKYTSKFVHKLVANAFIPNPNNYTEINHIDEDKSNNCVENLEWCSRQYNINYGERNAKASNKMKGKSKYIYHKLDDEGNILASYPTSILAAEDNFVDESSIRACIYGKSKTSAGFHWKRERIAE